MKFNMDTFRYQFTRNQATNEEIYDNIVDGMNMYGSNFIILMCAIIIASIGLNMNSVAVIIGAMLISPLMGSIIGIGYGVGTYNLKLLEKSFKVLVISILISVVTSTIYFSITPITTAGSEILARTSPTIWDVIIAFVGGIAGMIGLTRNKSSNVIPGVAIATALMPPLCTAGYGIATRQVNMFLGAFYLFFINGFFIAISTFIVTKALKIPSKNFVDFEKQKNIKKIIIIASIIIMIPSVISAVWMIRKSIYEKELNDFIVNELKNQYILSKNIDYKDNTITLVTVGDVITSEKLKVLNNDIGNYGLKNKKLIIKQEGIDLTNLEQYMESLKNKQNSIVNKQNNESNSTVVSEIDKNEIFNELRAIYPDIKEMYFGYVDGENDNNIDVLIIYSDNIDLNKNINNIQSWFKIRVNSDNARVYMEIINE
ncbi:TIGR00341 family protein [Clostridium sp. D53t1_180928_C8]|uniref:TIGR00341 family protein n=1 Tax=Clostridium sp. D53t1_180928_C8 TaxID=2787101 RepID=UPI0018A9A6E3|nr:TIGR00341 family protein [Clostridium sp. D53t1_180928_C8]